MLQKVYANTSKGIWFQKYIDYDAKNQEIWYLL